MLLKWLFIVVLICAPGFFMLGVVTGRHHIRKLANSGGEDRYPEFVQEAVEAYRDQRGHNIDSGDWR